MPRLMWYVCVCVFGCGCAGVLVSHLYGFGLLDAERMVKEAERWKRVPSQHECVEEAAIQLSRYHTNHASRDLRFESGLPLIPPPLSSHFIYFRLGFSHGFLSH